MKYEYHTLFLAAPIIPGKKHMAAYEHEINGPEFSRDVQNTIVQMSNEGFELIHSIPLISYKYHQKTYTEGATLIFRKENKD